MPIKRTTQCANVCTNALAFAPVSAPLYRHVFGHTTNTIRITIITQTKKQHHTFGSTCTMWCDDHEGQHTTITNTLQSVDSFSQGPGSCQWSYYMLVMRALSSRANRRPRATSAQISTQCIARLLDSWIDEQVDKGSTPFEACN